MAETLLGASAIGALGPQIPTAGLIGFGGSVTAAGALSGLSLLSGAFGAIGQMKAGQQSAQAFKYQQMQAQQQERMVKIQAIEQANTVRRQLVKNLASANASFAARGVALGAGGNPYQAGVQGTANATRDIQTAMAGGDLSAAMARGQGEQYNLAAKSELRSGYNQAAIGFGSLLKDYI